MANRLPKAAARKCNIPMADAHANRLNTFAFGSKCSFLNSVGTHSDTRLSRLRVMELSAWRLAIYIRVRIVWSPHPQFSKDPGYRTRINRILRRVMMEGKKRTGER